MTPTPAIVPSLLAATALAVALTLACTPSPTAADEPARSKEDDVRAWLERAPLQEDVAPRGTRPAEPAPPFDFEAWFREGRELPRVSETLVEIIEERLRTDPGAREAWKAVYALGWVGGSQSGRSLLPILEGPRDARLRSECAAALGRMRHPPAVDLLARLLADPNEDVNVRGNAAVALGNIGRERERSVAALEAAAKDPVPFVATCAQAGLLLLAEPPYAGMAVDAIEVSDAPGSVPGVPAPRKVTITDPALVKSIVAILAPRTMMPSGGENRWHIRALSLGRQVGPEIWVFDYGEWGYEGNSRGASAELKKVLQGVLPDPK